MRNDDFLRSMRAWPCGTSRAALGLLSLATALAFAQATAAQDQVLVLPVTQNDAHFEELLELGQAIDRELVNDKVAHLSLEQARDLFEQRHSRDPVPLSTADIDLFAKHANRALDAVASGAWQDALGHLQTAMDRGAGALESINRNVRTANQLFHACLLTVQVLAETGDEAAARAQARDCVVRSPGMTLPHDDRTYQPIVRSLLAEAQKMIARSHAAPITIESTRTDCAVYVNGKRLGSTPFVYRTPARASYLVQVECDGQTAPSGRVHVVMPTDTPTTLRVDNDLEGAVRTTRGALRLVYPTLADAHVRDHVRKIQAALDAPLALVLTYPQEGRVAIQRLGRGNGATIQLADPVRPQDLRDALKRLLDPVRSEPAELAIAQRKELEGERRRPKLAPWTKALGISAVGAGVTLTALSFWRHSVQRERGEAYLATDPSDDPYYRRGRAWSNARVAPYALGAVGTATTLTGALWLSLRAPPEALPWWAAGLSGGVGVGLATWGITALARGGACSADSHPDTRLCVQQRDDRDLGALLLLAAAPGLAVFVGKLARIPAAKRAVPTQAALVPQPGGAVFTVTRPL